MRCRQDLLHDGVLADVVVALDELAVLEAVVSDALDDLGAVDAGLGEREGGFEVRDARAYLGKGRERRHDGRRLRFQPHRYIEIRLCFSF